MIDARQWLTRQQQPDAVYPEWKQATPDAFKALIEKRRVNAWADFSERDKGVYRHIASLFPSFPVFACGSRVRGDYTEYLDPPNVKEWRAMAGKADKDVSDYDFHVSLDARPISGLPRYADRLRHGVAQSEKILIEMDGWDFSKLPETEHARVIELYNAGRWNELAQIHDRYKLSNYSYCCDLSGLKTWYRFGIEQGKIESNGASTTPDTGV